MTASVGRVEVDAASEAGVRNSQPEGIGRVAVIGDMVCWNNLGRNVVFADHAFRPRAVFGSTMFPGEDEPSQYDLDIHAILEAPDLGLIVVLNHFGALRGFRPADLVAQGRAGRVEPAALWSFVPDVERTVLASGRLIGSRPRSEGAVGVLVSAPLGAVPPGSRLPGQLCGTGFGEVTALAVVPSSTGPLIAVGGDRTLAMAPLQGDHLAPPRWERAVGFRVAALDWRGGALWAAGPASAAGADDYDWDQLHGGGFAAFDVEGTGIASGPLPGDVAWGTGGCAVAAAGGVLLAACRTGRIRLVDPRHPARAWSTPALAESSLGIAHLAIAGRRAVWGFNRGGYRLHASGLPVPDRA